MGSTEFVDPYLDPGTKILRNRVGARTGEELRRAEGDLVFARLMEVMDRPPRATGDLQELCEIHRVLFQDVYDWAGQLRTVDIRKNEEGAEFFLPVSLIGRAAGYAATELQKENNLQGLDRERFVERLAYHYEQFNYIHPFREGNGRAQRVFWNRIATDAGWQLDWQKVRGTVNDHACRVAAEQRDFRPLREMLNQITASAARVGQRDDAWRAAEIARLAFPVPAARVIAARDKILGAGEVGKPPERRGPKRERGVSR